MKSGLQKSKFGGILLVLLIGLVLAPRNSVALTYDFSGTVLYDSLASSSFRPGLGDSFNGSLAIADNGSLSFFNSSAGTQYDNGPGSIATGQFSHKGVEYLYAYSQGSEGTPKMGLVWWSEPRHINVQGSNHYEISGLSFYLEGYNYIPAYLIAQNIYEYIVKGNLDGFLYNNRNLRYSGCQVNYGNAFLGLITEPFIPQATPSASAVPLPAPIWLLGSGLALLWRRNKKIEEK